MVMVPNLFRLDILANVAPCVLPELLLLGTLAPAPQLKPGDVGNFHAALGPHQYFALRVCELVPRHHSIRQLQLAPRLKLVGGPLLRERVALDHGSLLFVFVFSFCVFYFCFCD